jgi:hypothetical protein
MLTRRAGHHDSEITNGSELPRLNPNGLRLHARCCQL